MSLAGPSRTAVAAALMRAIHTRIDHPRLIDDPWGDRLVSAEEKRAFYETILAEASPETRGRLEHRGSPEEVVDLVLRSHPTYSSVVVRSRVTEDALEKAVAEGARQYVLLGAGLDSFALRQPAFAAALEIFEVDHPATQAAKLARLRECGVAPERNVHFVSADLSRQALPEVLGASGFAPETRAFFSWLGVTIYLTREANLQTLRGVALSAAPGSEIVFTYTDQRAFAEPGLVRFGRLRETRALRGEPWISGFDPASLEGDLRALGLELAWDLDATELRERYCRNRTDDLAPGPMGHVACARVAAPAASPL